eukprot:scaffold17945_cov68-Phaeocystis_antarctica.AAC.4
MKTAHGDYACTGFEPELCLILVVEGLQHRREVRALLKRSGEKRRAATQPLLRGMVHAWYVQVVHAHAWYAHLEVRIRPVQRRLEGGGQRGKPGVPLRGAPAAALAEQVQAEPMALVQVALARSGQRGQAQRRRHREQQVAARDVSRGDEAAAVDGLRPRRGADRAN